MRPLPSVAVSRLAGDVAVDFFNTVDWRLDAERRSDRLPTYDHVLSWAVQTDIVTKEEARVLAVLSEEHPDEASVEHESILGLREHTYDALNTGATPTLLEAELASAHAGSTLARDVLGQWRWVQGAPSLSLIRHRIAQRLTTMMTSPMATRFQRCEDRDCGWVFLDTSRLHNRRWCSSADCGNRNRARTHYARQAASRRV